MQELFLQYLLQNSFSYLSFLFISDEIDDSLLNYVDTLIRKEVSS